MSNFDIRSAEELCAYIAGGGQPKYLCFWGHTPSRDGSVTKACFSQWFDSPFELDGIVYPTAEHFMMAGKARLFNDRDALERILRAPTPGAVKAIGREIVGFDDQTWCRERFAVVVDANLGKFSQHDGLKTFLLNTGDRILVEASPVDPIWGIGLAADDANALIPANWQGLNLLGFALMEVRARLADNE